MSGLGSAQAAVAPNGRLAYVANGESTIPFGPPTQQDIWTAEADGTGALNLTATTDLDEFDPAWSADGTQIAYISDSFTRTLSVMNADGSGKRAILQGAGNPSWGPDGTKVAYLGTREGLPNAIMIVDLVTGVSTVVAEDDSAMEPVWSPDGAKVAYVSVRPEAFPDPVTGEPQDGAQHEIVVVNTDGTGEVIVSAGAAGSDRANFLEEDRAPAWSPDGTKLVFMSQAQVPSCCGPWQLWAANADGSGLTNLSADDTVQDQFPAWSPDGTAIVFARASGAGSDLFTMPAPTTLPVLAAGAGAARLTADAALAGPTGSATQVTTTGNAFDPSWGARTTVTTKQLTVHVIGRGRVTSTPAGITCGTDCVQAYAAGTKVTLRATARPGSVFVRWTGDCRGRNRTCTVTLDQARDVTARFRAR
ncbi:MAG: hypothetical protein WAW88_17080 [Nocardioides sp.]